MTRLRGLLADDRGLIGKILILWIVLAVVLVVAAYDAGEILYARFKVADAAQAASYDAASTYRDTRDPAVARQAAVDAVGRTDPGAKMTAFVVDEATGQVTVTVTRRASTLVAHRVGFLRHFTKAKATDTSEPPAF
jgi:Flp pilus assembly protein TadG